MEPGGREVRANEKDSKFNYQECLAEGDLPLSPDD